MKNKISIVKIGKLVGNCYDFEDAWVGYNPDLDKIDVICAIHVPQMDMNMEQMLRTKISVNIAKEFGTKFVDDFCNISVINYL